MQNDSGVMLIKDRCKSSNYVYEKDVNILLLKMKAE